MAFEWAIEDYVLGPKLELVNTKP